MSATIRPQLIYPISLRRLTVRRSYDVSAGMRRVELEGDELRGGSRDGHVLPAFASDGFDDEIKIFLPDSQTGDLVLPIQRDRFIDWPRDPRPEFRTYTVRAWDADAGVVTIDFARHEHGTASDWADRSRPGVELHIAGPKMAWLHPVGADWLLIAGDDTAIPAIARWLETMPGDAVGDVFLEVPDSSHHQELTAPPGVAIHWVHRGSVPPAHSTALVDAVLAAPWREGAPFCWMAGETGVLRPIRRYLRETRDVPKERVEVTGYWRASLVEVDADEIEDAEHDPLHEWGELVPPVAIRVAVTLNLIPRIRAGVDTTADLAVAAGADPNALGRLLRYLATLDLLEFDEARWRVTRIGAALDDEDDTQEFDLTRPFADASTRALGGLLEVVRTGEPAVSLRRERAADPVLDQAARELTEAELAYVASSFGTDVRFSRGDVVAVIGDGADTVLAGVRTADPELQIVAFDAVSEGERVDTVLMTQALRELPDADAVALLRRVASVSAGRILLLEDALGVDEIDDHDAAEDLTWLCLTGVGRRTVEELRALVSAAGLQVEREQAIGWGEPLLHLRPAQGL